MKVLITGAGMLGSALAAEGAAHGHAVSLLTREQCDVTDSSAVEAVIAKADPELVFHTAALTRVNYCEEYPQEALRVNGSGTANVVRAAEALGARLVYFSTDYVFPGSSGEPILEGTPPRPLNAYGASKLAGEEHVASYALGHIVRISGVFGPRRNHTERNFFRAIFEKLAGGDGSVEVVDDQFTAVSHATDIAEMTYELLLIGLAQETHLISAGHNSWHGWAVEVARAAGAEESRILPVPTASGSPVERPKHSVLASGHQVVSEMISKHPATYGVSRYVSHLRGY
ncbi:MAG: NAD(P)-dependent oxidoreductase [bacterium]|nr:NAD(P)-dependent oxidoreductase [bacterium]